MKGIWLAAVCLSLLGAGVFWLIDEVSDVDWTNRRSVPFAEIAFIGTSLTQSAIPNDAAPDGLVGDGRRHIRVWVRSMNETIETQFLNEAIDAKIPTIVLEIHPFTRELSGGQHRSKKFGAINFDRLEVKMRNAAFHLRHGAKVLVNHMRGLSNQEAAELYHSFNGDLSGYKYLYPVTLRFPKEPDKLRSALRRANESRLRVVLLTFPRSETLVNYLGETDVRADNENMEAFAKLFGLSLWRVADAWPDDHFSDQAHMNARGRQRFVDAMRAKLAVAP